MCFTQSKLINNFINHLLHHLAPHFIIYCNT